MAAVAINVLLIVRLPTDAIIRVVIWSVIGIAIYLFYGIHYSKLNNLEITGGYDKPEEINSVSSSDYGSLKKDDDANTNTVFA